MPAVPPTPFLPSRLGEGYGEESLLMAQEPIFEDQSFADNTFWTSTPRPDRRTRECSLSEDCPDIAIVKDFDSGQGIDEHASTSVRGLEMQETEFSGRGERRTWLDEQGSEASSSKSKRGVSSPDNVSESKRARPRSPHRDDYYRRRLSRQGSSSSLHSPSLPSICLASSSSSSISRSRQISSSSYGSQSSMRRASISSRSLLNAEPPRASNDPASSTAKSDSPRPAPTRLSKFLARSSVLHPPKPTAVVNAHTLSPRNDLPRPEEEPLYISIPAVCASSSLAQNDIGDRDSDSAPSLSSISHTSLPPTPSLRKSTSQRVLGFLSVLVRSTSSSVLASSVTSGTGDVGDISTRSYKGDDTGGETDIKAGEQSVRNEKQSSGSGSGHGSLENVDSTSHHDRSRTSSSSHTSPRPPSRPTVRQPAGFVPLTKPTKAFISNTASRASNPIRHHSNPSNPSNPSNRSTTSSSFTSAALARLPPSGKGSSSSGERITIKPNERAPNLNARRALFERSSNDQSQLQPRPVMKRTIPLAGRTPGKASKARAEARQKFDRVVHEKMEEREQKHVDTERRKREEEEREYAARKKETVIRAKPVPEMYKQCRGVE